MANEITITAGLVLTNGNLSVKVNPESTRFDQVTRRGGGPGTVDVGTVEQTVDFGGIVPGFVILKNLDDTNFVELGFSSGVYGIKLQPGSLALFELVAGTSVFVKADTADCAVQITAINA